MELEEKMCFSFKNMLLILGGIMPERNNCLDLTTDTHTMACHQNHLLLTRITRSAYFNMLSDQPASK